jgi:hypothetical protein
MKRVAGKVSDETAEIIKDLSQQQELSQQDWVSNAIANQITMQVQLSKALSLAKGAAGSLGIHPDLFLIQAIRNHVIAEHASASIDQMLENFAESGLYEEILTENEDGLETL